MVAVLDLVMGIKKLSNWELTRKWWHGGYDDELPPRKARFDSPKEPNWSSLLATETFGQEIGLRKGWGGRSQGCVQGTSFVSSTMKEIKGVGTV